jgi:Ca-activated chloride channel family protein
MWVLERPAVLLLLFLVPAAVYLRHFWKGRGGMLIFPFGNWGGRGFQPPAMLLTFLIGFGAVAFWVGVLSMIVALAGPQSVTREQVYITRGVDIVVALDQSPTMAARDFQPTNRFEAAKEVITDFVTRRENDPIGLVGFGIEASLRVPPTLDYQHLLAVLDSMRILELGDGTAIGMGLAVAVLHLSRSTAPRRVIILITDGVNNTGEILPETAARAASSMNIQVYVVGIGSGASVELEVTDPITGTTLRGRVEDGFDEELLRAVAAAGGGSYFYAGTNGALRAVFDAIDTVERVEQRSLLRVQQEPLFRIFMLVGLGCLLLDFVIRRVFAREVL